MAEFDLLMLGDAKPDLPIRAREAVACASPSTRGFGGTASEPAMEEALPAIGVRP